MAGPEEIDQRGSSSAPPLTIRPARIEDVAAIRDLIADDPVSARREDLSQGALAQYEAAFRRIDAEPSAMLFVAEAGGRLVGTYQLTLTPYLSRGGHLRAAIAAVRVARDLRSRGIGTAMMRHALARAREQGATVAELMSDGERADAHRFYRRLGFEPTHRGFKLKL
ncbi:MAG: GNAT family N-acetyltransferase [Hyphomicrobiaceae bacterium]